MKVDIEPAVPAQEVPALQVGMPIVDDLVSLAATAVYRASRPVLG